MEAPPLMLPCPPAGTEQTADQAANQTPPADSSTLDTVSSVLDGVTSVADVAEAVFSIF